MGDMTPVTQTSPPRATVGQLAILARALPPGGRRVIGVTGAPGSGKPTVAGILADNLAGDAVVVPMDGFHLCDEELSRLGRATKKGAPDTFDVLGYVALLCGLRTELGHTVYAPEFDCRREMSVAGAIAVRPQHRIVITEGNYLHHRSDGWSEVRPLLDQVWFVESDEATRLMRLVRRHIAYGKDPDAARSWAITSDQANADLVRSRRCDADLVVRVE